MVFQYNPLDHHIEVVDRELVVTVCRLSMLSPRIRYNVHDAGGNRSLRDVVDVCRDFGLDPMSVETPDHRPPIRLPIMWVHGRSDSTISYMGANIYPEDVEQAIFADTDLGGRLGAFCLELREIGGGAVRPCVHVEVTDRGADDRLIVDSLRRAVVARLERNSRDFQAAVAEIRRPRTFSSNCTNLVRGHSPRTASGSSAATSFRAPDPPLAGHQPGLGTRTTSSARRFDQAADCGAYPTR